MPSVKLIAVGTRIPSLAKLISLFEFWSLKTNKAEDLETNPTVAVAGGAKSI